MSRSIRSRVVLSGSIALILAGARLGVADAGGDFLDVLEEENRVYAAARYSQSLGETPANVSVITRDDIRRFGYRSVFEALYTLPSFHNASNLAWATPGIRGFVIPGDYNSHYVFMINGMPVQEPVYGGSWLEQVDIESIERIEVVRGPGSALYGNGANLAVVNLVTRTGRTAAGRLVSAEAASGRTAKLYGSYGAASPAGRDVFLSASVFRSDGVDVYFPEWDKPPAHSGWSRGNNALKRLRLFGRLGGARAWLQGHLEAQDQRDPQASYGTVFGTNRLLYQDRSGTIEAGVSAPMEGGAMLTARLYGLGYSGDGDYPYNWTGDQAQGAVEVVSYDNMESSQLGAEVRYDRYFARRHHVLAGLDLRSVRTRMYVQDEGGDVRHDIRRSYREYGVFLQDEIRLGSSGRLFAGARYDKFSNYSEGVRGRLSPRVAYNHDLPSQSRLKVMYGEAYRVPTIYETYFDDGGVAAIANPSVKPEVSKTFEALFENRIGPGATWNAGVFLTRLKDSVAAFEAKESCDACLQYRNAAGERKAAGIEASVIVRQTSGLRAYGSVTIQRAVIDEDGERDLPAYPRRQIKAGASVPLPGLAWFAAAEGRYTGRMRGLVVDSETGARTADAPASWLINAALTSGPVGSGWRFSLRVNNVFDGKVYTIAPLDFTPIERIPVEQRRWSMNVVREF